MIPQETKDFLNTPKRHPVFFAVLYTPAVVSVVIACMIYRPHLVFLFPLAWCFLVGLFLVSGISNGTLTDNHGTAVRCTMPARFWGKATIWFLAYIFAIAWSIGFAVQEKNREKTEPGDPPNTLSPSAQGVGGRGAFGR